MRYKILIFLPKIDLFQDALGRGSNLERRIRMVLRKIGLALNDRAVLASGA